MTEPGVVLSFREMLSLSVLLKQQESQLDAVQLRIFEKCKRILFQRCTVQEYENLEPFYKRILNEGIK